MPEALATMQARTPAKAGLFLPYWRRQHWLGSATALDILDYAKENEELFRPSQVKMAEEIGVIPEMRNSLYLRELGPFAALLREKAMAALPMTHAVLRSKPFVPRDVELELVAHGDGAAFERHTDTFAVTETKQPQRRLTMVYYLHRTPKVYGGGRLVFHALDGEGVREIEPENDEMIAFLPWAPHAVEHVSVPGDAFADRRFALNIWIRA